MKSLISLPSGVFKHGREIPEVNGDFKFQKENSREKMGGFSIVMCGFSVGFNGDLAKNRSIHGCLGKRKWGPYDIG